jgi:hypothetical protein
MRNRISCIILAVIIMTLTVGVNAQHDRRVTLGGNYRTVRSAIVRPGQSITVSVEVDRAQWDVLNVARNVNLYLRSKTPAQFGGYNVPNSVIRKGRVALSFRNTTRESIRVVFEARTDDSAPLGCAAIVRSHIR